MIALSPRLQCAYELAAGARRVIDVGCDHAQLCACLVERGGAELAYASDIRPGPLDRARETIARRGLEGRVIPVLCDGLRAFSPGQADTILINGMGGDVMAGILEQAPWVRDGCRLILQPMSKPARLRRFLQEHGYRVTDERLAREDKHLYVVLAAQGAPAGEAGGQQFYLYTAHLRKDPLFPLFCHRLYAQYQAIERGRASAGLDAGHARAVLRMLEQEKGRCICPSIPSPLAP